MNAIFVWHTSQLFHKEQRIRPLDFCLSLSEPLSYCHKHQSALITENVGCREEGSTLKHFSTVNIIGHNRLLEYDARPSASLVIYTS